MRAGSTTRRRVERVRVGDEGRKRASARDALAVEEPLEIRIPHADEVHHVSVTMRTPGADFDLAAGFLYGEGLIDSRDDVREIRYCVDPAADGAQRYNIVNVVLSPGAEFDPSTLQRNFYMTSSCGVCGKASIESVRATGCAPVSGAASVSPETLLALPGRLRERQRVFDRTGGLHAAALFNLSGELLAVREDVGRHNAMDKLVGSLLLEAALPLTDRMVLVSGRLSFELVQKAARAGVSVLAGISAPSTLAVELAEENRMTLIGFLRDLRFNIYTGEDRIARNRSEANARG